MVMDPTLPRISVRDLMMQAFSHRMGAFGQDSFARTSICRAPLM